MKKYLVEIINKNDKHQQILTMDDIVKLKDAGFRVVVITEFKEKPEVIKK
jgi:hypothetical protein